MNFRNAAQQLGIDIAPENHHHARAGWVNIDCPLCGRNSKKYHLGYNEAFGFLNCWRCGKQGLAETLAEISGQPLRKVLGLIKGLVFTKPVEIKPAGKLKPPRGVGALEIAHKRYLRGRGFDAAELGRVWDLGGIGYAGALKWRIYIPIVHRGETVSWTTRAIGENSTRYISAAPAEEICDHKSLLYGEDYVRGSIIITEGPTDVWALGPGTVGTLGIGYTKAQILKMIRHPRRAVCFDNEPGALERARVLVDILSVYPGETFNIVLDSEDAGNASEREKRKIRKFMFGKAAA